MKSCPCVRRGILTAIASVTCLIAGISSPQTSRAQSLIPDGARLQAVGQVAFTEGPVWHPDGTVYFSDVENSRIMQADAAGRISVFRSPSGKANGLAFDPQGRLLACEGGNRRVTRTENDGTITVLADRFGGKRFNSPNDLAVDSQGNVYFTDPRYGNRDGMEIVDDQGEPIEGVYRIATDGKVTLVLGQEMERPNGIAVSRDDRHLFVAVNTNDDQGSQRQLLRFDLSPSGSVDPASKLVLFDWGSDRGPDGIALDSEGRVYATAGLNEPAPPYETADRYKAGVYVISPTGQLDAFIAVPIDMVTNCAFGGADRKTLYVTAGHKLWKVPVTTPGYTAWPRAKP
ncbi:SMP-30/gluconolactonase/LRE family protein [Roseiconus nitratireducens]|uniref:SMP-30/gluconolactonase/LRE family protein n=1 Tax=Roseiconus nitratireducens TaxID=2605748 RepID=A0A5M6D243_9BACT|nr:SMP-30/gluconolactonase/LRE family protein [Roseiconus nitratireducens]KAA5541403.1 SMP-30/gluconolactonase/LRE family protein [Roseiconus nitratireducens]